MDSFSLAPPFAAADGLAPAVVDEGFAEAEAGFGAAL